MGRAQHADGGTSRHEARWVAALAATLAVAAVACSSPDTTSGSPAGVTSAAATASTAPAATATATPATTPDYGDVTFTPDVAHAATATVTPDAPVTIAATGADGTTWTLAFAAGTVPEATDVTLTPMATVSGSAALAPKGGVIFAPDGLELLQPAVLTISGPDEAAAFVVGDASGHGLVPAAPDASGSGFDVEHFSAGVSSPDDGSSGISRDPDQAIAVLRADLDAMLEDAEADDATPDLPTGTLTACQSTPAARADVNAAVMAIRRDGQDAIARAKAERNAYVGHIDPDRQASIDAVVDQIESTWHANEMHRVAREIKRYDDQAEHAPEQYPLMQGVVAYFSLAAEDGPGPSVDVGADMQAWGDNIAFALVERVQDDHDYELLPLILELGQNRTDSGSGVIDSIADALHKALRFDVTLEMQVQAPMGQYAANIEGQVQAATGFAGTVLPGAGTGTYESGEYAGGQGEIVPGQTWPSNLTVSLHPCEHTADVGSDSYGTLEQVTVHGITVTSPLSGLDGSVRDALAYLGFGPPSSAYFSGNLANEQAATTTTTDGAGGGATFTFTLTLTHDPEPWTAPPPEPIAA